MKRIMQRFVQLLALGFFVLLIQAIVRLLGVDAYLSIVVLKQQAYELKHMVVTHYIASVVLYEIVFIIAVLLFLPVTIALSLLGGFLFGVVAGTGYAVTGATLASVIIFLLVRHGIGKLFQRRYAKRIEYINSEIKRYGAWYLMVAQMLPFSPTWLLNVGAGLTRMSVWTFGWATAVGLVPGTFLYALIGQQLPTIVAGSIRHEYVIGALFVLTSLVLVPLVLKRYWDAHKDADS